MRFTSSNVCAIIALQLAAHYGCSGNSSEEPPEAPEPSCGRAPSGYAGDCLELDPPNESEGFQLHFGPAERDDAAALAPFILAPGDERVDCVYARSPNEVEAFYSHYVAAIRPGTHHLVVSSAGDSPDVVGTDKCAHADSLQLFFLVQGGTGPEGKRLEQPSAEDAQAPENRGLAARLQPRQSLALQLHSVNTTEEPLLREAWANLYFANPDEVTAVVDRISFNAGTSMAIPPHTRQVIRGTCEMPIDAPDELRIIDLFGHMHAHGERVSLWRVGGTDPASRDLVYESYDWSELELLSYNSVRVNPEPDPVARTAGGFSGNLTISRGERIEFECDFNNTEDFVLRFAAFTYTAEMCTVLGTYAPSMGAHWFCTNE